MPGRPEMLVATEPPVDPDEVLERMKKAIWRNRIRMADFFSDFDRLRTGYVSEAKFRTALVESNAIPLSEGEMQARRYLRKMSAGARSASCRRDDEQVWRRDSWTLLHL